MTDLAHDHLQHAHDAGRGREACTPSQIPTRGWIDILWRVKDEIAHDRIGLIAAGTTFYLVLALFPALAAFVSLFGLLADRGEIEGYLSNLQGVLPSAATDLLSTELHRLTSTPQQALSLTFLVSVGVALWTANNGVKALFDAMNIAYDEVEKRGFVKLTLISLTFTLGTILFTIVMLNVMVGVPLLIEYLNLGILGRILLSVLPALVLFAVASVGIALLYRFGPSRAPVRWRWITWGSASAALIWMIASALFSLYLANWTDYSATYGSLGTAIGAMVWIYLSTWIVLAGAELNAEIEHQTAQDTTQGPDKPLGARGAEMADSVGQGR